MTKDDKTNRGVRRVIRAIFSVDEITDLEEAREIIKETLKVLKK